GPGGKGPAGGSFSIYSYGQTTGALAIRSSTINGNTAVTGTGGLVVYGNVALTLQSTIVANSTGSVPADILRDTDGSTPPAPAARPSPRYRQRAPGARCCSPRPWRRSPGSGGRCRRGNDARPERWQRPKPGAASSVSALLETVRCDVLAHALRVPDAAV